MRTVEGRDPATGDVLRLRVAAGRVQEVERLGATHDDTLPHVAPGLVDLQVNGYAGHDVNGAATTADGIAALTHALAGTGVTTWVPTVVTAGEDAIAHALRAVAAARSSDPLVARAIPFAHVEGPFISDRDGPRGVHDAAQVRPLDAAEVARWSLHGPVGYVTVSPHTPDAPAHVARVVAAGVAVAVGHTHATPAQITAAVDAGASLSTHLGNGIDPHLPRHPNALWTQLADDRLTCGFVADGHHLPADTLRVMLRAKGPGRAFLVSDAVALAGAPAGVYDTPVGGQVELTADGRLTHVGTPLLAGAAADLAHGLRFVTSRTGTHLADALDLVTRTPGAVVRAAGGAPCGTLRVGAPADLVLLDAHVRVVQVLRAGEPVEHVEPSGGQG